MNRTLNVDWQHYTRHGSGTFTPFPAPVLVFAGRHVVLEPELWRSAVYYQPDICISAGKIQVVISRRSQTPLSQQSLQWFTPTWIWLGPNLLKSILERRSKSIGSGFSATRIFTREEEINHQTPVTSLLSRVVTRAVVRNQIGWLNSIHLYIMTIRTIYALYIKNDKYCD